ncbi:hypothetical protein B0H15DRAFT_741932, partial [Mycena belliarum]
AILHDEPVLPDPLAFRPERYLTDERAASTVAAAFGFGRRQVPARKNSVFIAIAGILCMFRISKAVDEHGATVTPAVE